MDRPWPLSDLFHVALLADWEAAQQAGDYRVSTIGRSLEEEGFLHASFAHQWQGVLDAYYAGVDEPLVLLEVDPDLLGRPGRRRDCPRAPTRRSRTCTGRCPSRRSSTSVRSPLV